MAVETEGTPLRGQPKTSAKSSELTSGVLVLSRGFQVSARATGWLRACGSTGASGFDYGLRGERIRGVRGVRGVHSGRIICIQHHPLRRLQNQLASSVNQNVRVEKKTAAQYFVEPSLPPLPLYANRGVTVLADTETQPKKARP